MSKAFTEISAGLTEAIEHAKGKSTKVVEHKVETINVKAVREKNRNEPTKILCHLWYFNWYITTLGAGFTLSQRPSKSFT